jgi:hypothetical protein
MAETFRWRSFLLDITGSPSMQQALGWGSNHGLVEALPT